MSKRAGKLPMLQARNALRPFFNARRDIPRATQFQTVRKVVPPDELARLYSQTEHNRAYRFPGLGNTFPRDPDKVPDATLRRLSSLSLSREVELHVARLNHHADALGRALTDLATINDAVRMDSWTDAETLVAQYRQEHGLSLAAMRKDLLVAFQNFGLSGLARRYAQIVEGTQPSSWALLAHITYDLMDPGLSPERATRRWLRGVASPEGFSYCATPAVSEMLTCWPTKSALAEALLRYSAASLVDLAL
ncbi:MAG: hypothetical protein ABSA58_16360, partial [Acetobacteraceae bacterium]